MKKTTKRVIGMVLLIAILFSSVSVGKEVEAAKQIKNPYGKYVATGKQVKRVFGLNKIYLSWEGTELDNWDQITISQSIDYMDYLERFQFKKIGTNKYRSRPITIKGHYLTIKLYKNKVVMREHGGRYLGEGYLNITFKLKKRDPEIKF